MTRRRSRKQGPKRPQLAAVAKPPSSPTPTEARGRGEKREEAGAPLKPPPTAMATWGFLVLLGGIAAFYLVLKSFSLQPFAGDEFIYIYQGKLVAEGETPYRDFAMAHPPIQSIFTAVYLTLFGTDLTTLRLLPVIWCLAGGLLLAFLVRREYGGVAGLFSVLLYLTAHEPLRSSSHFTGVNMAVALLIATVFFYRGGRIRAAAVFAVLSVFTRLYAIPAVAVLTLFAVIADKKSGLRLMRYGAIIGTGTVILFGLWTGFGDMVHNMLLYHAQKTPMNPESLLNMKYKVLFHNATLSALFVLAIATLFYRVNKAYVALGDGLDVGKRVRHAITDSNTGLVILSTFIATGMLVLLTNMDRVWMYYFIPSFPFAAVGAGWMIDRLLRGAVHWGRARGNLSASGLSRADAYLGVTAVLLFGLSYVTAPMLEGRFGYYQQAMAQPPAKRDHSYVFKPGPLPEWVNAWVEYLLWHDTRTIGEPYNAFNYYLWHESRVLDVVDEVVTTIEKETGPEDEIFGDSGTVPLYALLSGRRIAGNEVDTNIQRYRSGNADPRELISKIDNDKTKMIILRRNFGVFGVSEVRRLVEAKYRLVKSVRSAQGRTFLLFKRDVAKVSSS